MSFDQAKRTKAAPQRSSIADLYSASFDMLSDKTTARYMILTTPRSGSTLLSVYLAKTGTLGLPLEYLNLDHLSFKGVKTESHVINYLKSLERRRSTPNGVFGLKLFSHFANQIGKEMPGLFRHLFESYYIIQLFRKDRVAQAISDVRARQTGRWFADQQEAESPEYIYEAIASAVRRIHNQEQWCIRSLKDMGITAITVYYEDFVLHPNEVVQEIKSKIANMTSETPKIPKLPELQVQRDEISELWKLRFNADKLANIVKP